jgi:hypothetical protein
MGADGRIGAFQEKIKPAPIFITKAAGAIDAMFHRIKADQTPPIRSPTRIGIAAD